MKLKSFIDGNSTMMLFFFPSLFYLPLILILTITHSLPLSHMNERFIKILPFSYSTSYLPTLN